MALGQTAGYPRANRAKLFMCSPRNTGNINFSLWLTGGLSQGCPRLSKSLCVQSFMCLFLALFQRFLTKTRHWPIFLRSYLSTFVVIVKLGTDLRQDLAIQSQKGSCDSSCQPRPEPLHYAEIIAAYLHFIPQYFAACSIILKPHQSVCPQKTNE